MNRNTTSINKDKIYNEVNNLLSKERFYDNGVTGKTMQYAIEKLSILDGYEDSDTIIAKLRMDLCEKLVYEIKDEIDNDNFFSEETDIDKVYDDLNIMFSNQMYDAIKEIKEEVIYKSKFRINMLRSQITLDENKLSTYKDRDEDKLRVQICEIKENYPEEFLIDRMEESPIPFRVPLVPFGIFLKLYEKIEEKYARNSMEMLKELEYELKAPQLLKEKILKGKRMIEKLSDLLQLIEID